MPLTVGSRVGQYEILGVVGAGGMGEVYRARDAKLQREVAIKVLPAPMADTPRRLLRFEREARALAALNHPNIATVYGIEEPASDGSHGRALIMEFVSGEDLAWRLKRGPVPLADVLPIARQVAEALAAAHDAGIVHRDLKPANIKVRGDGTVKVLDFGLATARSVEADAGSESGSSSGSGSGSGSNDGLQTMTLGADLTEDGAVLGTAAYMAPEQAKGKPVDKRADIWAFGVVLFEMLAGRRPFASPLGKDAADTVAHILAAEPDWSALPADTPPPIRRLLARCLTKDRRQRLHDIADARIEIEEAIDPRLPGTWTPDRQAARASGARRFGALVAALIVGLAGGAALGVTFFSGTRGERASVMYARIDVSPATELNAGGLHPLVVLPPGGANTALRWSPNGGTLAFIGKAAGIRRIYLRPLASDRARPIDGTEDVISFAFSPDGGEIAFSTASRIKRVKTAGGLATDVTPLGVGRGIAWGQSRIIASSGSLYTIDLATGKYAALRQASELVHFASPFLLPGDRALLFTEYQRQWTSGDERVMVMGLTEDAEPRVLLPLASDARYLPTGHLVFMRQGTLYAVRFDVDVLELRGDPVPLLKDVSQSVSAWDSDDLTLGGHFDVSSTGTLAYVSSTTAGFPERELVRFDRSGAVAPLGAPLRGYRNHVEISPGGRQLAVVVQSPTDLQLFAYDLDRKNLTRMADALVGEIVLGSWAPDNRIAIGVVDEGTITTAIVRADGATEPLANSVGFWPSSLGRDGALLGMKDSVWLYETRRAAQPRQLLSTPRWVESGGLPAGLAVVQPMWSPDQHWLAYTSNTTGRFEVYVRSYPGPGEPIAISTNGGSAPAWNPSGHEIFYVEPGPQETMVAVLLSNDGHVVRTQKLFTLPANELVFGSAIQTPYAVAPDGKAFYATRFLRTVAPVTNINLVLNWFEELKSNVREK